MHNFFLLLFSTITASQLRGADGVQCHNILSHHKNCSIPIKSKEWISIQIARKCLWVKPYCWCVQFIALTATRLGFYLSVCTFVFRCDQNLLLHMHYILKRSRSYTFIFNGSIYKLKCDCDIQSAKMALLPKTGSCMQALAIILQFIWFLSNQTDKTRYHPEQ